MTDSRVSISGDGDPLDGLASVVRERIDALAPAARDALAVIAVGGPLPQTPAVRELGLDALVMLDRAQLARTWALPGGPDVRLADHRYLDVVLRTPDVDWSVASARAAAILRAGAEPATDRRAIGPQVD